MKNTGFILLFLLLSSCGDNSTPQVSVNYAPVISGSISEIRVGEFLNFLPTASDANSDILLFDVMGAPSWASFDVSSGRLTGIPDEEDLGNVYNIIVSVSDGELNTSTDPFNLTVTEPIFFVSVEVTGLDEFRSMDFELSGCFVDEIDSPCSITNELIAVDENGSFRFSRGLETGSSYELRVDKNPGRQECVLDFEEGTIVVEDISVGVSCSQDASAPLFALDKIHKIRLIINIDEWLRFVLDTERANYKNSDAHGRPSPHLSSHSEVYRQVDFEYLDSEGIVLFRRDNVGFKMKGATSRQWPESIYEDVSGDQVVELKRFPFGLKFDEKFDEDEGVYSCINASGVSAKVRGHPCFERVGKDLDEVPENDGRKFMDVEKLSFKINNFDPSYQRELLAHDILNSIGVPASRVSHAEIELQIIGDTNFYGKSLPQAFNMGVYQMVEQVDKTFLKRYFRKSGYLFKAGVHAYLSDSTDSGWDCVVFEESHDHVNSKFCQIGVEKSDPNSAEEWLGSANYLNPNFVNTDINDGGEDSQFKPYKPRYDLKTKKSKVEEGRALLTKFIRFIQTYPTASELTKVFDTDGFIKAQAAEIVMGAVDHYVRVGNNYYLYLNPLTDKWIYIPNDFDFVFRNSHLSIWDGYDWALPFQDIAQTYALPSSLDNNLHWVSRNTTYADVSSDPILWDIVFSQESNKIKLYSEIRSILDNQFKWEVIKPVLIKRNELAEAAIYKTDASSPEECYFVYDPVSLGISNGDELCDPNEVSIKSFIELRSETLYEELRENGIN